MAETEAIFKLRVDTGNSVNDVENLTSAVKETQTATEGKGVTDFEKKLNQLDKTLAEGNLTFRQRSRLIKEYQQIALQAGEASPVGDRAVRSAAALTDQLGDMNQRVRLLSSDTVRLDTALQGISVGASAFQGVQSAIALTGVENEQLIQSMQKLQAVQGVVNSIQAITNALNKDAILGIQLRVALEKAKNFVMTGSIAGTVTLSAAEKELGASTLFTANAMKVLRVALIALGIPALIILIGYLVTNFDKVTKAVSGAYERVMRFADGVKGLRLLLLPLEIAVVGVRIALEKLGLIENDQDRKREANHNAQLKRIEAQLKKQEEANKRRERAFNNEQKAYEREIALLDSVGKSSVAVSKMKIQASIDYQKEKLKELQQEFKAIEFLSKSSEFYAKFYGTERMEILRTSLNDAEQAIKDSETQLQVLINSNNKKKADEAKKHEKEITHLKIAGVNEEFKLVLNASKKRLEADFEFQKEREKLLREYQLIIGDIYEDEALDFAEKQREQEFNLRLALQNNIITNEEYNNALEVLLKEQAEFEVDLEKRKQEAIKAERDKAFQDQVQQIEKIIGITQQFVGVTNALNGLLNASDQERLKQVKGNAVEEEKIKRRMFERDKKQRIAQTAIDTAANVVRSVANGGGIPAGIPFGIAAGAMGALQIAAISKQSFDGSSGGGSFNAPPPSTQAPVTTANETNPNNVGNNLPKMTKVVVVENDITRMQKKVQVTESLSGF
jgi:hypothetical protein